MLLRIFFTFLWAAASSVATLLVERLLWASFGMGHWKEPSSILAGQVLSVFLFVVPTVVLCLGLAGVLPGTRPRGTGEQQEPHER